MQITVKKNLILFFALFCISHAKAQNYRPWTEFKNDTLAYVRVNFIENQSRYVGERLEKLINDYELSLGHKYPMRNNQLEDRFYNGINIGVEGTDYDLNILFKPPFPKLDREAIMYLENWSAKEPLNNYLGDKIILRIDLVPKQIFIITT